MNSFWKHSRAIQLTVPLLGVMGCGTPEVFKPESHAEMRGLSPLSVSTDGKIVDNLDNEVLLRGVNITSLGEYWQGNPDLPPTVPTTEEDFQKMASRGLSVIRLIVNWSKIEPNRGEIDQRYLDEVEDMVELAAQYGIYSVIDMHQDAYSAFIFTPDDEACPEGSHPGKGWDGAPDWATITDGLSTCISGERNSAPAVVAAWNHFYSNTDGIQDHFVGAWAAVAERFAGRNEVAGYDLLNEPETSMPSSELLPIYENLLVNVINAISEAEADSEFQHLLFIEPTIPAGDHTMGIVLPDPERMGVQNKNIVNATHNYAESIELDGLSLEQTNALLVALSQSQKTGLWIGEYGFWSTAPDVLAVAERFAADEDNNGLGGAWWQWRQPCGDPHSLHWGDGEWLPDDVVTHLHGFDCVANVEIGETDEFLQILGRAYPRVVAGRISNLESNPHSGEFLLDGETNHAGQAFVIWTPTANNTHSVEFEGAQDTSVSEVDGGRIISGVVPETGPYRIHILSDD
ncbi:MAG: cellulase family glycosylhydrolase [Myxococcota bacterium]|nr:cellulase family glycosylhydrolase [Myxococcota bacterium]